MAKYRKKPVVIEAWPIHEIVRSATKEWSSLPGPVTEAYENGDVLFLPTAISIRTLEGWMTGNSDDMLIQGVKGELYPCKPDIFEATYEPVEHTESGIEVQPLDWDRAKKHLDFYEKTYRELGPAGALALGVTIIPLQDRYARGERTKWLYDDIMEVE